MVGDGKGEVGGVGSEVAVDGGALREAAEAGAATEECSGGAGVGGRGGGEEEAEGVVETVMVGEVRYGVGRLRPACRDGGGGGVEGLGEKTDPCG